MKLSICDVCAVTAELCAGCQSKLDGAELTQTDVDLARALYRIDKRYGLGQSEVVRAFDAPGMFYIFTSGDAGALVGKGGRNVRELGKLIGKTRIRAVRLDREPVQMAQDLVFPAKLIGLNKSFSPQGVFFKVRLSKSDELRLPCERNSLAKVLALTLKSDCRLAFE